ncbi:hypothetical protein ACOME3_001403 [Neoechinorhynchus agilis]
MTRSPRNESHSVQSFGTPDRIRVLSNAIEASHVVERVIQYIGGGSFGHTFRCVASGRELALKVSTDTTVGLGREHRVLKDLRGVKGVPKVYYLSQIRVRERTSSHIDSEHETKAFNNKIDNAR